MKSVKDILNGKKLNAKTINENAMVIEAFTLMETENMDYVIVMEEGNCVGIISEVDYMHKIMLARKNPAQTKVKDIMSSSIHSVSINEPIHRCLELMDTFKIRHLLVFDGFMFKGVITLHDLMLAAFDGNVDNMLEKDQENYALSTPNASGQNFVNLYN